MSSLARDGMQGGGRTHSLFMFAILFSFVFLLASCTAKRVEVPTYEGADIQTVLSSKGAVRLIDSNFSIEFERDGGVLRGDAVLKLTPDALDLQVYSLGFLVAEITANDTVTRSNPPIDRNRIAMLVDGIRNSFFWWSIKDYDVREDENLYRVSNSWRRLFLNKRTLLPERQVIDLEDGRELNVLYEEPDLIGDIWFPSRIRIELSRYSVHLRIKTLAVTPE